MASYNPPNEYITKFNTKLFNQPEDTLSQAEANNLYLSKTVADTSTSPLTTFNGQVAFNNFAPISNTLPSIATHLVTKYYTDFYFLTISTAASTYQTIAGMSAYLTTASASATYQTISGMSAYLTTASAASIYQTIAGMSAYLTIASASTTYQTISGMSAYLTTASAASIYQTIAGMSAYLTTASASATYQTIAGMSAYQLISNMVNYVDLTTAQTISGLKLFTNNLEVFNSAGANLILRVSTGTTQQTTLKQNGSQLQIINNSTTPSIVFTISTVPSLTVSPTEFLLDSTCFLTTNDIKSRLSTGSHSLLSNITTGSLTIGSATSTNTLNGTNTINGTTTFSVIPLCSVNAISTNQLVNYTTLTGQGFTTLPIIQANANVWTGTNTFNTSLPTSTISATSANQLVNYTTLNAQGFTTLPIIQANANVWTGTNTFNTSLPTSTITATTANQLVNYTTLTSQSFTTLPIVLANANTFSAYNIFNDEVRCNSWLNLFFRTRIYDLGGGGNYTQLYMLGGTEFIIAPNGNSDKINFFCKDGVGVQTLTFSSASVANTSNAPFISNGLSTFNNGAIFNTVIPTTSITATTANQIVNYTTLTSQSYTTLPLVQSNNSTYTGTNIFSGDITLSRSKNNSSYATYNALSGSYIGYVTESIASIYLATLTNTQYQVGAITLNSSNVGFYICNYEVEINSATAGNITKAYIFVSDNNISTTVPIVISGAVKNDFSTNTYTVGDSMYYSGSFTFLQSTVSVIYALQVKIIIGSGTYERKGSIRMTRII